LETSNIEASINEQSAIEKEFKKRMNRAITITVLLITSMYLVVVLPLVSVGTTYITMHIIGFVAMILVFPVLTFFAGMWLVWKKKFFPSDEKDKE